MIGMLTTPTSASTAPALSARRGSSIAACSAMKPKYRNSKISSDVSRASQTHQVPQVGLPHSEPVHSARSVKSAPVGAIALAIIPESRVLNASPNPAQNARAPNQNASFPARGKKVWGEEYLNQLTLMQYRSIHSDEMRSATAAAQGAKAPANTSSAPSSSSCACPPSPETALSAALAPMMRTGAYNGSTSSESSAPAPRNPRVSAAPIAPMRLRAGVPRAKDSVNVQRDS